MVSFSLSESSLSWGSSLVSLVGVGGGVVSVVDIVSWSLSKMGWAILDLRLLIVDFGKVAAVSGFGDGGSSWLSACELPSFARSFASRRTVAIDCFSCCIICWLRFVLAIGMFLCRFGLSGTGAGWSLYSSLVSAFVCNCLGVSV